MKNESMTFLDHLIRIKCKISPGQVPNMPQSLWRQTKSFIINSILQILLRHCLKGGDILIPDQLVDDAGFRRAKSRDLEYPHSMVGHSQARQSWATLSVRDLK
jgi:hypothetical protein